MLLLKTKYYKAIRAIKDIKAIRAIMDIRAIRHIKIIRTIMAIRAIIEFRANMDIIAIRDQTWNLSQTLHGQDFSIICLPQKRVNYNKLI